MGGYRIVPTHPRMLPRVVKGEQEGHHGITNNTIWGFPLCSFALSAQFAFVSCPLHGSSRLRCFVAFLLSANLSEESLPPPHLREDLPTLWISRPARPQIRADTRIGPNRHESNTRPLISDTESQPTGLADSVFTGSHQLCRSFLKTAYEIPPTCGRTGGVMFRIDFRISGCWRIAREGGGA
jgi:hypothetical protein